MTTFTNRLRLTLQETGTNENTWGEIVNTQLSLIEDAIAGKTTVDVTTGLDVTLTSSSGSTDESRRAILALSGTPTANINVIVPEVEKLYVVDNKVLGSNSVTLKTTSGTGIVFAGGDNRLSIVYCDGTDIKLITEETQNTDDLTRDNITATTDLTVGGDASVTGGLTLTGNFTGKGVNVSSGDTTSGYLNDKLVAGNGLVKSTLNGGGDEDLQLAADYASQPEAEAGTNNTKLMTPLRVGEAAGQYMVVVDEKPSGTGAGNSVAGTWVTRDLNTVKVNRIAGASLSSNQITLPSGDYIIEVTSMTFDVQNNRLKLYNITDSTDTVLGGSYYSDSANNTSSEPSLIGYFTIAGTKTFEVQHRCDLNHASGFGLPAGFGVSEVYTQTIIRRIG